MQDKITLFTLNINGSMKQKALSQLKTGKKSVFSSGLLLALWAGENTAGKTLHVFFGPPFRANLEIIMLNVGENVVLWRQIIFTYSGIVQSCTNIDQVSIKF